MGLGRGAVGLLFTGRPTCGCVFQPLPSSCVTFTTWCARRFLRPPPGAGSAEPRPRSLPSSRIERALLTFPQEHAWDVVFAVLPWVAQSLACRGCPDQHVTTQVRLHTQAHTSGTYPPEVWSKHHKLVYGGAQRSVDVVAAFEAAVVTESAESAVVVGLYRARCCALLVSPDGAGLDARYTCGACQK